MQCWVWMFDVHVPEHEPKLWAAALQLIADLKPHGLGLGGDFGEWGSGNHHAPAMFRTAYEDDAKEVRAAIRHLRAVHPAPKPILMLEGNHENFLLRMLSRDMPSMVKGFWDRWAVDVGLIEHQVDWIPEMQQPLKIGNSRILHGHQVPGRNLPKFHANKVGELYGGPGLTLVFGHSHREQMHVRANKEGNVRIYAAPCMRKLDPDWTKGAPDGWVQGLVLQYLQDTGAVHTYVLPFEGGKLVWGGKTYG